MAALGNKISLAVGTPIKLNSFGVIAGAGTLDFSIPEYPNETGFHLLFQVVGTITTLTAALQVSLDGGTTFNDYVPSANFLSSTGPVVLVGVGPSLVITNLPKPLFAGAIYRINITAASGSQDIWVVMT